MQAGLRALFGLPLASLFLTAQLSAQAIPQTVSVGMPDGVTLATDVWRPLLDSAPRPVLLRRTPYGRAIDLQLVQNLVNAGFIVVSQDVRGRGQSGGDFLPFFPDKIDGAATIDWIAEQAWSTGKVGTFGGSAEGIVQFMAMASAPEALQCAYIMVPSHDMYESLFPGGAWRTELNSQWLTDLGAAPVIDILKAHEVRDSFWDDATLSTKEMAAVDHPVFILGGMFDVFAPTQVRALRELQEHADEAQRENMFMILGPWTHGGVGSRVQGQLLYPSDAPYENSTLDLASYLVWCLQNGPRPSFPQVRYYLTEVTDNLVADPNNAAQTYIEARGEWRETETWPPPDTSHWSLYLHDDKPLHGELPRISGASVALDVNPQDPVPSLGGGNLTTPPGPFDQASLDARDDVFVVQTAPVTEVTEVVGTIRARIWAASATSDVDVIVRAEVLTPGGKAVAMTDGVLRGRFVRGFEAIAPLTPGRPERFSLDLGPIAVRLPVGHALRFAISGTSNPRYEPNPNTSDALATHPAPQATKLTIYRDSEHPSEIWVPLRSGALPDALAVPAGGDQVDPGPEDGGVPAEDADIPKGDASESDVPGANTKPDAGCGCRVGQAREPAWGWALGLSLLGALIVRRRPRVKIGRA